MIKKEIEDHFGAVCDGEKRKRAALGYIWEAWHEAIHDGVEPETLANAAIYAALSDLVSTYGEEAVAGMAEGLPQRVQHGEFTADKVTQ